MYHHRVIGHHISEHFSTLSESFLTPAPPWAAVQHRTSEPILQPPFLDPASASYVHNSRKSQLYTYLGSKDTRYYLQWLQSWSTVFRCVLKTLKYVFLEVIDIHLQRELTGSNSLAGYRKMHAILRQKYALNVKAGRHMPFMQ